MNLEIEHNGQTIIVQILDSPGQRLYRASFRNGPAIFLTRALNAENKYFWTSIPEGQQELAQEIGALIQEQLKE